MENIQAQNEKRQKMDEQSFEKYRAPFFQSQNMEIMLEKKSHLILLSIKHLVKKVRKQKTTGNMIRNTAMYMYDLNSIEDQIQDIRVQNQKHLKQIKRVEKYNIKDEASTGN